MCVEQKGTRLDHAIIVVLQAGHLGPDDIGVSRHAEVVIAVESDGVRPRPAAMQNAFSAPLVLPVGHELLLEPLAQAGQQRGVVVGFGKEFGKAFKYLHKVVPLIKTTLLKTFSQIHTSATLSELTVARTDRVLNRLAEFPH